MFPAVEGGGRVADPKAWNLWHGCHKYSEGCENCYMFYLDALRGVPERARIIRKTGDFDKPMKKNRKGEYKIPPGYVLRVNMTSDTFLEEADEWRKEMWDIIRWRSDVHFFLLTKRVQRMAEYLPDDWGEGYENVELSISVENQRAFDERWPVFERIPAKHKSMSLAPFLGPIDIAPALASGQIEHVELGGEGFGGHRPCHYEWVKDISMACEQYRVNFTFEAIGALFVKGGKQYLVDRQDIQKTQAYRSGLSRFYGAPEYKLYDPYDGHLLSKDELRTPMYHAEKCPTCPYFHLCVGCTDCGNCRNVRLVDYDTVVQMRERQIA